MTTQENKNIETRISELKADVIRFNFKGDGIPFQTLNGRDAHARFVEAIIGIDEDGDTVAGFTVVATDDETGAEFRFGEGVGNNPLDVEDVVNQAVEAWPLNDIGLADVVIERDTIPLYGER